ncbi:hypothetical protein PQX77_005373 [Marasmius sp. AFHP31]|nr:hypothetical protein PQX77_005373 [Marasmius sp. AFHP31]
MPETAVYDEWGTWLIDSAFFAQVRAFGDSEATISHEYHQNKAANTFMTHNMVWISLRLMHGLNLQWVKITQPPRPRGYLESPPSHCLSSSTNPLQRLIQLLHELAAHNRPEPCHLAQTHITVSLFPSHLDKIDKGFILVEMRVNPEPQRLELRNE